MAARIKKPDSKGPRPAVSFRVDHDVFDLMSSIPQLELDAFPGNVPASATSNSDLSRWIFNAGVKLIAETLIRIKELREEIDGTKATIQSMINEYKATEDTNLGVRIKRAMKFLEQKEDRLNVLRAQMKDVFQQ